MVVVGADTHKRSHTCVAVDEVGRKLAEKTVSATGAGHGELIEWAHRQFGTDVVWAVEDCRNMSGRLERDLTAAGYEVVRVPTKMMAKARACARTRGKSDPIDALAVAHAALREPDLPRATYDETAREMKLLVDRRETLVRQRTETINSLRERIHGLAPEYTAGPLDRPKHQQALGEWLGAQDGLVAELARDELADIRRLTDAINALATRIQGRVENLAPTLLELAGCGALTAAKILGETAGVTRFRSEAAFACHTGTAPIPVWSGSTTGQVRLNRSGNRQLNAALYRIALTQTRIAGRGQDYYRRKITEGKTTRAALRCLKRHIAREVYRRLHTDHKVAQNPDLQIAA